ncbi:hypothetical protein LNJ08_11910 [Tenacibaculum finnmarkense genomovar ulcerans]|uniref:hypothetical protein n=1 Tax=Tenacibaculum finnmarkense TaxID=2781243 RepID=UPI001E612116|nr:hypothetical protein [Tenacibaculum finnmarkense]MCD8455095.1 hypothetical protein [Tenacibaculum finnmarkense genomovar ulcerans]
MNIEEQYRKPNLASDPFFYFNSDELEANITFVKEKKIENLMLISNSNGYNLKDLGFLHELPFIKNIEMGACQQIEKFDGLLSLSNLNTLVIAPNKKVKINLSQLKNLKNLSLSYNPKIIGLEHLINLESLNISSGNDAFYNFEMFTNFKKLNTLKIVQASITDLTFLKENNKLEHLEFSHMRKSFSIEGIQYLKNSLKKLKFISSKKIDNINLVSQLTELNGLFFSESVKLDNAKVLKSLIKLEAFNMYGSSSFIDGDLRSLKEMRDTIKHYKVKNKKHYFYE